MIFLELLIVVLLLYIVYAQYVANSNHANVLLKVETVIKDLAKQIMIRS